jgi:hypothetical protein
MELGQKKKYVNFKKGLYSFYSPFVEFTSSNILEDYLWHTDFAYLNLRGYKMFKIEEQQYFSESSQFGMQNRQIKGGAIKAFQENLQQLVQLIKVHLMPLLDEIKKAEFYYIWMLKIKDNDKILQDCLKAYKQEKNDNEKSINNLFNYLKNDKKRKVLDLDFVGFKDIKRKRDEAIKHIKDKWVAEIDGGRMYQLQKTQGEQGLDMTLLPQLFFGIELQSPLDTDNIEKQLEGDIYSVDITEDAKRQVARFMFRFYTWLPTAIKDTELTFKLKISALRQFFHQIQMYVNFMKPLLVEINKKTEGFENGNYYSGGEEEDPQILGLFDMSYNFIRLFAIKGVKNWQLNDFKVYEKGVFIDNSKRNIFLDKGENKTGFLNLETLNLINENSNFREVEKEELGKLKEAGLEIFEGYKFISCESLEISNDDFWVLEEKWEENKTYILKNKLLPFTLLEMGFTQRRRVFQNETQQGPTQQVQHFNKVNYEGYAIDFVDIVKYRESIKSENLELLSSFIGELDIIKEDLEFYYNYFQNKNKLKKKKTKIETPNKVEIKTTPTSSFKKNYDKTKEVFSIFKILKRPKKESFKDILKREKKEFNESLELRKARSIAIMDVNKTYRVFKKTKRFYVYAETR